MLLLWIADKFKLFRNEIEDLKLKVSKERERYQNSTQSFNEDLSAIPMIEIKHSVTNLSQICFSIIANNEFFRWSSQKSILLTL